MVIGRGRRTEHPQPTFYTTTKKIRTKIKYTGTKRTGKNTGKQVRQEKNKGKLYGRKKYGGKNTGKKYEKKLPPKKYWKKKYG